MPHTGRMTARTVDTGLHRRTMLAVGETVMALGAAAGSVGLVSGSLDVGDVVTSRLPFASPVAGGVALAVVVAVPMSVAAVDAWRGSRRADVTAVAAGVRLRGWIVVEVAVIRSVSWLQPACFATGAAIAATGWRGRRS